MSWDLLSILYPRIVAGLEDESDDVVGASASSLLPVVNKLLTKEDVDVDQLLDHLWKTLSTIDDITR